MERLWLVDFWGVAAAEDPKTACTEQGTAFQELGNLLGQAVVRLQSQSRMLICMVQTQTCCELTATPATEHARLPSGPHQGLQLVASLTDLGKRKSPVDRE